jgi:serine protease Do
MWLCSPVFAAPAVTLPEYDPARSLAPLVESVAPAVVTIEVESSAPIPALPAEVLRRLPFDPHSFPQTRSSVGSGFFVSERGEILTNWHVVDQASSIVVVTTDGRRLPARVLGGDEALDIALLDVDAEEPWLTLGESSALRVGDWVVAMGNGLGLGSAATVGIVSGRGRAMSRDVLASDFIQTDAAINEGNSGGPLFSLDGHVVGMSTATIVGANTIGFAIPSDRIRAVLDDLRTAGSVRRGYLGIAPGDGDGGGAAVVQVWDDTPARSAGLAVGDRILRVDDQAIDDARDLVVTISSFAPGRTVKLQIDRGGQERTLALELGVRPTGPVSTTREVAAPLEPPTATVTRTEEQTLHELTLRSTAPSEDPGVLVTQVGPTSPFRSRLQRGDRITSVNQHDVATAGDVAHILARSTGDVTLEVVREGVRKVVVATLPAVD